MRAELEAIRRRMDLVRAMPPLAQVSQIWPLVEAILGLLGTVIDELERKPWRETLRDGAGEG